MTETLTLKNIVLRFLNRIANPNFENKAIAAFLFSGFIFVYCSQPLNFNGRVQLDLGILKADLSGGNDPNWYLFSFGVVLITYGGFALYKIKISPSTPKRNEINELILLIEQKKSSLKNAQIQQFFLDIFKIKPSIPVIEYLLATDDPIGQIHDYRYASHFFTFNKTRFYPKQPPLDHNHRVIIFSWAYYILSIIGALLMAAPSVPIFENSTKITLIKLGFPLGIALLILAMYILNPIRAHSSALRLNSSSSDDSPKNEKDGKTVFKLLSEIHTPTFDSFIYFGRLDFIYDDILHFWEGFNAIIISSSFHLHNQKLRDVVADLHESWQRSLSFASYFVDTNNASLHKFDSRHDIYRNQDARTAHEAFTDAIITADKKLRELLAIVREDFPEIDIEATNLIAMNDFRRYQISFSTQNNCVKISSDG